MLSVYKIKPAFQKLLMPLLKVLFKMKVTANQITIAAVFLSIGIGVSIVFSKDYPFLILLVPIGYLLRMTLNALDGMMATHYNMKSKLGEVLNELGDVISDSFIIFPLMVLPNVNPIVLLVFGILAIINEFTGILAKVISQERRYDGPMGKSDRALVIGLFCLIFYFWEGISLYGNWIFSISSALVIVSSVFRIKNALK